MTLRPLTRQLTIAHPALYAWFREIRGKLNARRHGLAAQGVGSYVTSSATVHRDCRLGDYAFVGPECRLTVPVTIGRYSMLAPRVAIVGADHIFDAPGTPTIFAGRPALPKTIIGSDVWLGYGVIVLAGVTVGDATIVGAGSVVTSDLPPASICVGNPARPVRSRFASSADLDVHHELLRSGTRRGRFAEPR